MREKKEKVSIAQIGERGNWERKVERARKKGWRVIGNIREFEITPGDETA